MNPVNELSVANRLALFLYSTRNIVGCLVALAGPVLLFSGVIRDFWLPITAGMYAIGFFATPSPRLIDTDLTQSLSVEELTARLDALLGRVRPALPAASVSRLERIRSAIHEVLPRLMASTAGSDDLYTVRETVLHYLPETLSNYLALPPLFRTTRVVRDKKTAQDLLVEQLTVLDEQLQQVVDNVSRGDVAALLANGRFLEAKFKHTDFLAPASGA